MDSAPRRRARVHLESTDDRRRHSSAPPDIESYARARGWCDGESPFDFAASYSSRRAGKDKSDPLNARGRLARSRELVARNGRRTIREMLAVLRDHGTRGETPPAGNPAARDDSPTLCMHGSVSATTASMVAELPAPGADTIPVLWASLAAPCTSIAFPLFVAGTLPPVLAAGGEKPSPDSPWWRFRKIQDLVAGAPDRLAPIAWKHFRPLEAAMLERAAEVSRQAASSTRPRARNYSAASWRKISSAY